MRPNVRGTERLLRLLVGAALIVAAIAAFGGLLGTGYGVAFYGAAAVGLFLGSGLCVTGALGWCRVKSLLVAGPRRARRRNRDRRGAGADRARSGGDRAD